MQIMTKRPSLVLKSRPKVPKISLPKRGRSTWFTAASPM
jgi:hypothetical protein